MLGVRAWFGGSGWSGEGRWMSEPVESKLKAFVQEARCRISGMVPTR